jgi:ComF family protein
LSGPKRRNFRAGATSWLIDRTGMGGTADAMEWPPAFVSSLVGSLAGSLTGIGRAALDVILPPRCLSCAGQVDRQGTLCLPCWSALTFISPPHCACCGEPFDVTIAGEAGDSLLCARCIAHPPAYGRARSVLSYDDGCRGMILGFKHADQTYAATAFGTWLARAGADLLVPGTVLAPVPLHRWKLFTRRYNQAALLAHAVGRHAGLPVLPTLVVRHRRTRPQGGHTRTGRHRNVRGAFHVRPGLVERIRGCPVVLVDDVLTTGATVSECARVLLRAGASRVDVLTLARVPNGGVWRN